MKKLVVAALVAACLAASAKGGNWKLFDTTWHFDTARIKMPDGTALEVSVKNWRDYENSDMIQVEAKDGTVYLTHSVNVVLVKKGGGR